MRLIHRYILREILQPTLIGTAAYSSVLLMNRVFNLVELAIRKSISPWTVLQLLAFSLPRLLAMTIPMAVLLGVLVGIGRLAADSEVVALRASGVGRSAFVIPVLLLAIPAALLTMGDLLWLEPKANHAAHQLYTSAAREVEAGTRIRPGTFYDTIPGTVLYAMGADTATNELTRMFLYRRLEDDTEEVTLAERGSIRYDPDKNRIVVNLKESRTHTFPADQVGEYQYQKAAKRQVVLPPDPGLRARIALLDAEVPKNFVELSLPELIARYREAGNMVHPQAARMVRFSIRTIIHEKVAIPAACIVFGMLALGLGLRIRRSGKTSGFAISTLVIIAYWALYTTGRNLSTRGILPPTLGLWGTPALFLTIALFLLLHREQPGRTARRTLWVRLRRRGDASPLPSPRNPVGPYTRINPLSLLDQYVLAHFLRAFLYVTVTLYVIFLLMEYRELVDEVIENGQPFSMLWEYSLYRFPWSLHQILPMASLIGCVTALGLLTRNNEVTALQSAGVSLYRIAAPVLIATIGISSLSYLLQDHLLPATNRRAVLLKDRIKKRSPRSWRDPTMKWLKVGEGEMVNYRHYRRVAQEFQGVSIYRFDPVEFRLTSRTFAQRGRWHGGRWVLENGWFRNLTAPDAGGFGPFRLQEIADPEFPGEIFHAGFRFPLSFLPDAAKKTSEQMAYPELRAFIQQLRAGRYNVRELEVALHNKLSFPCIPLVMVLIGVPFAFRTGRRGTMVGLGMSLLLVLIYYAFFAVLNALGNAGFLPPALAAWGPNLLFAAGAVYLLAKMKS